MIKLIVIKGKTAYDMSELVLSVIWSGRKGAAARTLSVMFLDDDGYGHSRTGINVEEGHKCIFYWNNKELFRGMFMRQDQNKSKTMSVVAYDNSIYLANNKDTFSYTKKKKASSIFKDCCKRFGIPYTSVADTKYKIPPLSKPKTTAWDVICDALSQTYKATGVRYYPICVKGKLKLIERRLNVKQWVIETGVNLEDYRRTRSIEKLKTRIKIYSKEGKVIAKSVNSKREKKIGVFQDVSQAKEKLSKARLKKLVKTTLGENNKPERSLSVTALGLPDVTTGVVIFIKIKELGISKSYYVEEDTHTFQGNHHQMKLSLAVASGINK